MSRGLKIIAAAAVAFTVLFLPAGSQEKAPAGADRPVLIKAERPRPAPDAWRPGFESITARDSRILVSALASDLFEGRETGSRGFRLASDYAASLFALWGLEPGGDPDGAGGRSYFQTVVMKEYSGLDCSAVWRAGSADAAAGRSFREGVDLENYYVNRVPEIITGPVVFAGYGIQEASVGYDDLAGVDIRGKIVLILDETPGFGDSASPFMSESLRAKYAASGTWVGRLVRANALAALGAKAVLVARNADDGADIYPEMGPGTPDDESPILDEPTRLVVLPGTRRGGGMIGVSREMADALLAAAGQSVESLKARIASGWKPASFEIAGGSLTMQTTAVRETLLRCRNVVAVLPGGDPALKDEAVVVGAHLDHLGSNGPYVFNGADDNASGAAGVLEMARAAAGLRTRMKRSLVFGLWTAEEHGLLGSTFYARHPAVPLAKTTAYLNLDMIGRFGDAASWGDRLARLKIPEADRAGLAPGNFATVALAAGRGLDEILREADRFVGLDLWLRPEARPRTSGLISDDGAFGRGGVPYLAWNGLRHADYHRTGDAAGKIDFEGMAKVVRLAYLTMLLRAGR